MFGPDFPFAYDDHLGHPAGLGQVPAERHGTEVAIIGAGIAGLATAYELMKLGLRPVVYEASRIGGRLRSQRFGGTDDVIAELGAMRFPPSSTDAQPLFRPGRPRDPAVPEPARRGHADHGDRARGRGVLRGEARRPAAFVPRGRRRRGARRSRRAPPSARCRRRSRRATSPRIKAIWNPLIPVLGRAHLLRLHRHLGGLRPAPVPPSRGVRPGRLRHRRLGHRFPQLDARDPARRLHQRGRGPPHRGRRRRAAAAAAVAAGARADRALAARHHARDA